MEEIIICLMEAFDYEHFFWNQKKLLRRAPNLNFKARTRISKVQKDDKVQGWQQYNLNLRMIFRCKKRLIAKKSFSGIHSRLKVKAWKSEEFWQNFSHSRQSCSWAFKVIKNEIIWSFIRNKAKKYQKKITIPSVKAFKISQN